MFKKSTHSMKNDPQRDEELMALIRQGDKSAFMELVDRWELSLRRFFLLQGANPEEAEDFIQETFLRIFKFRDRYQSQNYSFRAFIFRVGRNVWIDTLRSKGRKEKVQSYAVLLENEPLSQDPTSTTAEIFDAQAALIELPFRLRAVVVLNIYEGLQYSEISQVLGIPVGTVKSRMFHALKILRGRLGYGIES